MKSFIALFTIFTRSPPTALHLDLARIHVVQSEKAEKALMHVTDSVPSTHPLGQITEKVRAGKGKISTELSSTRATYLIVIFEGSKKVE